MTDREMAEEFSDRTRIIDENTKAGTDCISLVQDYEGNYIDIHERIKQAYLAGLKAEKEMEKPYDYRSVIYAIEHIILGFGKDISPNLRNKLNHWKKNIQEELKKEN